MPTTTHHRRRAFPSFLVVSGLVILAAASGCGKSGPSLVRVTGTVTVDGTPPDGAVLIFHPAGGKGNVASAAADATGAFEIMTNGTPGVVAGSYKVTATWPDPAKKPQVTLGASPEDAPDLLGGRYVSVDKSPTTVDITSSTKQLQPIALTTK